MSERVTAEQMPEMAESRRRFDEVRDLLAEVERLRALLRRALPDVEANPTPMDTLALDIRAALLEEPSDGQ